MVLLAAQFVESVDLILDVDDKRFFTQHTKENPFADRIVAWFAENNVILPNDPAHISRAIICGLAHAYAKCLREIEEVSGEKAQNATILGGGGRNQLFVEITRIFCHCPVEVGAFEATALSNAVIQAVGLGLISEDEIMVHIN